MSRFGNACLIAGICLAAIFFVIPASRIPAEKGEAAASALLVVAFAIAAVIVLTLLASKSRSLWWTVAAALVGALNMLVTPWIVAITLAVPAILGMPPLMFSFWTSLAAMGILFGIKGVRMEPKHITNLVVGGSFGLAGFALLITQTATSAAGYETTLPVFPSTSSRELDTRSLSDGNSTLSVSYDNLYVHQAYFDEGFLRVTRPAYFRSVNFTVVSEDPTRPARSGGSKRLRRETYVDAMQSLVTMGLVKSLDPGLGYSTRRIFDPRGPER